jgi:hypothetical protein
MINSKENIPIDLTLPVAVFNPNPSMVKPEMQKPVKISVHNFNFYYDKVKDELIADEVDLGAPAASAAPTATAAPAASAGS